MDDIFMKLRDMGNEAPRLYIVTTGAGGTLLKDAWCPPGASSYYVGGGGAFPYDSGETAALLGFTPEKFVSTETAIDLAMAAYVRAWVPGRKAIGLGMTCSVASTHAHRGDHRVAACVFTDTECWVLATVIPKGVGPDARRADDVLAASIAKRLLAFALFPKDGIDASAISDAANQARQRLMERPFFNADGTRSDIRSVALVPQDMLLVPGTFNPLHAGHLGAARASLRTAASNMGRSLTPVFSTTIDPPHKPALTTAEALQRVRMMRGHAFLLSEGDPLYIDKARRFPGAAFMLGADAMDRMLDPHWCPLDPMMAEFDTLGTRFLVPARMDDGVLKTCATVLDSRIFVQCRLMESMFLPVSFRMDISSTDLRGTSK